MKYSNEEMLAMYEALKPFLGMKNMVGYAAARNSRLLFDVIREYAEVRTALIVKYGSQAVDEDGNETGEYSISLNSEEFEKFAEELDEYAKIKTKVKLFKIDYKEAIGTLTGEELLSIDFMFYDAEDEGDDE